MADATILLISNDKALVEQIRGVSSAISGLGLSSLSDLDAAFEYRWWDQVSLVVVHHTVVAASMRLTRLLRMIAAVRRPVSTIVIAEPYDPDQAITLFRLGVADYLDRPLDLNRLTFLIDVLTLGFRKAANAVRARGELSLASQGDASAVASSAAQHAPAILDGDTPAIAELIDQIQRVASQSTTILLGGETGTGKTRLARRIHELSDRRAEPFLVIDCGSLASPSGECDLFGHVQGAFEGATTDRPGKFADAGRGTLFFDGVDALPLAIQAKLLRVVEDRAYEPIGATRPLPLLARLIAASNRPLDEEVTEQRFRSDLYYRLNVVGFQIPPLRERRDAIPLLTRQFLNEFAAGEGREFDSISDDALQALHEHHWPGNVRELRNVLERCVAICRDRSIRREDLPIAVLDGTARVEHPISKVHPILAATFNRSSLAHTTEQAELARIAEALEKHGNNRLRAASELGISRMTLYKKLHKYGFMPPSSPN